MSEQKSLLRFFDLEQLIKENKIFNKIRKIFRGPSVYCLKSREHKTVSHSTFL